MKRIVSLVCLVCLLFNVNVFADTTVISFSDVPSNHWAYEHIMDVAKNGYIVGTSEVINGVGTFEPNKSMTRAEMLAVVMRITFPNETIGLKTTGEKWWSSIYDLAVNKGILAAEEFENGNMDAICTREEMATIVVRGFEVHQVGLMERMPGAKVPDFESISYKHMRDVFKAYSIGVVGGVDENGTFSPKSPINRASAAIILYRLYNEDSRLEVDFESTEKDEEIANAYRENNNKYDLEATEIWLMLKGCILSGDFDFDETPIGH